MLCLRAFWSIRHRLMSTTTTRQNAGSLPMRILIYVILRGLALLPLRWVHALGALIGWLHYKTPNTLARVTRTNIDRCLPDWSKEKREALVRKSLIEAGKAITEIGPLWLWPKARIDRLIRDVEGEHYIREAVEQKRGVILAVPHLGTWEVIGLYIPQRYPMTILYRQPKVAALDGIMRHSRERMGARLVSTDARGVKALLDQVRNGGVTGILPDQEPGIGTGQFAPFFGIQAYSMVLVPRLAEKTQADVIFAYAQRLPKGRGYKICFMPPRKELTGADVQQDVAVMNQATEELIRLLPEQYQWGYKRFKSRPQGEDKFY